MATKKEEKFVKAAVLRECGFGKPGDVVQLPSADAEVGSQQGMLDPHPDAVKHAESLKA